MEFELYYGISKYLVDKSLPKLSPKDQEKITNASKNFQLKDGQLFFTKDRNNPRLVIKADENLKKVLNEGHAGEGNKHFKGDATAERIARNFYWPRMTAQINEWVKTCEICQRAEKPTKNNPLRPIKVTEPFELIGMDLIGPLPVTEQGNRFIVVMTEYLTKWVEAKPITNKRAETIAEFLHEILARFGTPRKIITDQGTEFNNETIKALNKIMGIQSIYSSPYHPQTNGQTERTNRTLCETLSKIAQEKETQWDKWLNSALWAYRNKKHSVTNYTPAFLLYGMQMRTPLEMDLIPGMEKPELTVEDYVDLIGPRLSSTRKDAEMRSNKFKDRQKGYYDKKIKPKQFKIGDKVLLYDSAKQMVHGDKFRDKYKEGIFRVQEACSNGTYRLLDEQQRVTKITTGDRLKEYHEVPAWEAKVRVEQTTLGPQSRLPISSARLRITYNKNNNNNTNEESNNTKTREQEIREENERRRPKGRMLPVTITSNDKNNHDKIAEQRRERIELIKNSQLIPKSKITEEPITEDTNMYNKGPRIKQKPKFSRSAYGNKEKND